MKISRVFRSIAAVLLVTLLTGQSLCVAHGFNLQYLKPLGSSASQMVFENRDIDLAELKLTYELIKLDSINLKALGNIKDFMNWLDRHKFNLDDIYKNKINDVIKIIVESYMHDDLVSLRKGTLEARELDILEENIVIGDYKDYIHVALLNGLITVAGYESSYFSGFGRGQILIEIAEYFPFTIYPAFIYDENSEKTRQPSNDIVYALTKCGIYNSDKDVRPDDTISALELASLIYILDAHKYRDLPDATDKVNKVYHGIDVSIEDESVCWLVRNDLIYCLDSIPEKWIIPFKNDGGKFSIKLSLSHSDFDAVVGLYHSTSHLIELGDKNYAANKGIPEHELAHYLGAKYNMHASNMVMFAVEQDEAARLIRDYAKTNTDEYFAECVRHLWMNRNNPVELERFKNGAPLTYHAIYEMILKDESETVIDSEKVHDYITDWYLKNIGI